MATNVDIWDKTLNKPLVTIKIEHFKTVNGPVLGNGVGRITIEEIATGVKHKMDFSKSNPLYFRIDKKIVSPGQELYVLVETSALSSPSNYRASYNVADLAYNVTELVFNSRIPSPVFTHLIGTDDARIGIVGFISAWNSEDKAECSFSFDTNDKWMIYEAIYTRRPA